MEFASSRAKGCKAAQVILASAGYADVGGGMQQTRHGQYLEAAHGSQAVMDPREWRAAYRDQEIDRDRLRAHFLQRHQHVHNVLIAFALADNAPGADLQPGFPADHQIAHAVGESVGGADVRIEALAGIEVMVYALKSGLAQAAGLLQRKKAKGAADGDARIGGDGAHNTAKRLDIGIAENAAAEAHAKASCFQLLGLAGLVDELFSCLKRIAGDIRLGNAGLRAVMTVFATEAALGVAEHLDLDALAKVMVANLPGGVEQGREVAIRGLERCQALLQGQRLSCQHVLRKLLIIGHHCHSQEGVRAPACGQPEEHGSTYNSTMKQTLLHAALTIRHPYRIIRHALSPGPIHPI